MRTSQFSSSKTPALPHVLFIPKWWPDHEDPQLGDFLRKQGQAAALCTKVSVLHIHADKRSGVMGTVHVTQEGDLWEAHSRFPASTHSFSPWRKAVNLFRYIRAANIGWQRVRIERGTPDLVHVHILVRPALVAFGLRTKYGIPYIISEQSSEYLDGKYAAKGFLFTWLNKMLFRRAEVIVAVSTFLGDALLRHGLCREYKVVPNVVPGLDRPLPAPGQPGQFMVVADLVDRTKNVSGVLRALSIARKSDPSVRLTLIGEGPDRARLEQLCFELGIREDVQFLGRLTNKAVLDHMANTGAVVINSNVETFSVVTGEALAQGKPVIATRCGGPEAFITEENGILIDIADDRALAEAMLRLANDRTTYSPERIRNSVNARSSPEAVGRSLMSIYTSIVPPPNA